MISTHTHAWIHGSVDEKCTIVLKQLFNVNSSATAFFFLLFVPLLLTSATVSHEAQVSS